MAGVVCLLVIVIIDFFAHKFPFMSVYVEIKLHV